jgi:C4-dicarboxylate-specific signal transduction histidine kinase
VGRDITERKRMEAQVKAAQTHLIQAARMATIGEVASGVAHQIYNPLTTIIADAQILLRSLGQEQPGRDSAEAIEQAGWRLQQVVQRLMEFSRSPGEASEPFSLNDSLRSAISLVSANLESAGSRLQVDLDTSPFEMVGYRPQLEALWVNLLLLARDAAEANRSHTIWVSTRLASPDRALIEVCDDGRPIPQEQLAAVFEPNFLGPISGRGTGIEYSICREIVRQYGGEISAESTPEPKTIFRVQLPREH